MISFAVIASAMIALAVGWVIWPLAFGRSTDELDSQASNLHVLRDEQRVLDDDHARGAITTVAYERAREELERRVLAETARDTERSRAPRAGPAWVPVALAAVIPIAAILMYLTVGTPIWLLQNVAGDSTARDAAGSPEQSVSPADIERMVAKLAARMEAEPNNLEGWTMLARSYYALQRFGDATKAFERAIALAPNDAGLHADFADAIASSQDGKFSGRPLELIQKALALDPAHVKALALAGSEAYERGAFTAAIAYWQRVQAVLPQGSPLAERVSASISDARARAGGTTATTPSVLPSTPRSSTAAADQAAGHVGGTVSLSPALRDKLQLTDTVFIFARDLRGGGMPLAVLRKQVKDLPAAFTLDDSLAMTPNMLLSKATEVIIVARVSRSGNAAAQSGDATGSSGPVKPGTAGVVVTIDQLVP